MKIKKVAWIWGFAALASLGCEDSKNGPAVGGHGGGGVGGGLGGSAAGGRAGNGGGGGQTDLGGAPGGKGGSGTGGGGGLGGGTGAGGMAGAGGAGGTGALTAVQARGKYLVDVVIACGDCHTPRLPGGAPDLSKYLAGNAMFAVGPGGAALGSRNLTNDETGLKNRTDEEIKNMFLNGVRPTQTGTEPLNPVMPYYVLHNMTDADASAIVAYLRVVPAVNNPIPRRAAFWDVADPAMPIDLSKVPTPSVNAVNRESALRGRYLTSQAGLCIECHTQHVMGDAKVLAFDKLFAGGEDFSRVYPNAVSKNLTSDATGLAQWSTDEIVAALKQGVSRDGKPLCPPMPGGAMGAYGHLDPQDATDIANYLKSLPPIANTIPGMCVFPPPAANGGAGGAGGSGAGGGAGGMAGAGALGGAGGVAGTRGGAGGTS